LAVNTAVGLHAPAERTDYKILPKTFNLRIVLGRVSSIVHTLFPNFSRNIYV